MNNTTALPETIPEAAEGIILAISVVLMVTIVVTNTLTICVIRHVDMLREKYGILLVGYCSVDILDGVHVLYGNLRLWIVPGVATCKWRDIVLNSYDNLPYALSS